MPTHCELVVLITASSGVVRVADGRSCGGGGGRRAPKGDTNCYDPVRPDWQAGHNVLNLSVRLFVRLFVTKLVNTMF